MGINVNELIQHQVANHPRYMVKKGHDGAVQPLFVSLGGVRSLFRLTVRECALEWIEGG
jgi:hypothetical protein